MPRILYDHLLTESGFDLLTEAGDALVLREIGMAGDATASGGLPGSVAGTGRVIAAGTGTVSGESGTVAGTGQVIGAGEGTVSGESGTVAGTGQVILRGTCTAHGTAGQVSGTGRIIGIEPPVDLPLSGSSFFAPTVITIRGHGATHGQPGCVAGRGHITLVGKGKAAGQPGSATGKGHLTLVGKAAAHGQPGATAGSGTLTLTGKATAAGHPGTTTIHARTDPYYHARQEDDFWLMAA